MCSYKPIVAMTITATKQPMDATAGLLRRIHAAHACSAAAKCGCWLLKLCIGACLLTFSFNSSTTVLFFAVFVGPADKACIWLLTLPLASNLDDLAWRKRMLSCFDSLRSSLRSSSMSESEINALNLVMFITLFCAVGYGRCKRGRGNGTISSVDVNGSASDSKMDIMLMINDRH